MRIGLIHNLWCICNKSLEPRVTSTSDQEDVSIITQDSIQVGTTCVYACHMNIIDLWLKLSSSLTSNTMPWRNIRDFSAITSFHEHKGNHTRNKTHMEDFKKWLDHNNLIDIPTNGSPYTLSNGRVGRGLV